MADVRLTRIMHDGRDLTLCVVFTDDEGNSVSLAFDPRPVSTEGEGDVVRKDFKVFSPCPIFDKDNAEMTDSTPMGVIRNLRMALGGLGQ